MSKQKDFYLSQEEQDRKEAKAMFAREEAKHTAEKLEAEVLDCECNSWIHPHPQCWDKSILVDEIKKEYNLE